MLKSFCIKTNNKNILDYLLNEFENVDLESIFISINKFKNYDNIFVHYKGTCTDLFISLIANILCSASILFYEKKSLSRIINYNYFYFSDSEKKEILNNCLENLNSNDLSNENIYLNRNEYIYNQFLEYSSCNDNIILDGFVNFRLKKYISFLDNIVDTYVNKFIIEKEYIEFINLLKIYISSEPSATNTVNLVYYNQSTILLDENENIIPNEDNILKTKYLSDISFSSNDFALNVLLNLLPKNLIIHIIDSSEDEFINTLKLVFDTRVTICSNCSICSGYKLKNML